jgi:hypothetical protein
MSAIIPAACSGRNPRIDSNMAPLQGVKFRAIKVSYLILRAVSSPVLYGHDNQPTSGLKRVARDNIQHGSPYKVAVLSHQIPNLLRLRCVNNSPGQPSRGKPSEDLLIPLNVMGMTILKPCVSGQRLHDGGWTRRWADHRSGRGRGLSGWVKHLTTPDVMFSIQVSATNLVCHKGIGRVQYWAGHPEQFPLRHLVDGAS